MIYLQHMFHIVARIMTDTSCFAGYIRLIRDKSPLIHNITNYVAMNLSANALLALGASPLMSSEEREMEDISAVSDALVINLGCIETSQIRAAHIAASEAFKSGKPWVLDPVGAGLSLLRTSAAVRLAMEYRPSVIRANASETIALANACQQSQNVCETSAHGMDSGEDSAMAIDSAKALALQTGAVVSVSGSDDYITDGQVVVRVSNGHPLMPRVTAMGCTASAVTAAFLAVTDRSDAEPGNDVRSGSVPLGSWLEAAAYAMLAMGLAGETAAQHSTGPGTFVPAFIDALANLTACDCASKAKFQILI